MKRVGIIGFPMDLGGNKRGVDMGPSALRLTEFEQALEALGIEVNDLGNVIVHTRALIEGGSADAHFLGEILRACEEAARMTGQCIDDGMMPLTLGGDHTVALGSLLGTATRRGPGGVIWIDAHADLNTPGTSLSGNVHGMALAIALGLCNDDPRFEFGAGTGPPWVLPEHTVLIGTRNLDPGERDYLRQSGGPTVFTMSEIDRRGISSVAEEAVRIAGGGNFLHVTLDLDAMDPLDAPGVGTPVRGGLAYREAHTLMEILSDAPFSGLDVVEVNPVLDSRNKTANLASELIASLFGKRIL